MKQWRKALHTFDGASSVEIPTSLPPPSSSGTPQKEDTGHKEDIDPPGNEQTSIAQVDKIMAALADDVDTEDEDVEDLQLSDLSDAEEETNADQQYH